MQEAESPAQTTENELPSPRKTHLRQLRLTQNQIRLSARTPIPNICAVWVLESPWNSSARALFQNARFWPGPAGLIFLRSFLWLLLSDRDAARLARFSVLQPQGWTFLSAR